MRIKTGIRGFDELVEGGLIAGRQYLVSGSPGAGKTTFGVQFIATGALIGEPGAYVALSESLDTIITDMSRYDMHIELLMNKKRLFFIDIGPTCEYGEVDELAIAITNHDGESTPENAAPSPYSVFKNVEILVRQNSIKRLVIDSLSAIKFTAQEPAQEERCISRFIRNLKRLNCTTLLLSELTKPDAYTIEQFSSHGVIFLHNYMDIHTGRMARAIQVIKMRGTKHDCELHPVEFTSRGLRVLNSVKH